MTSLDLPTLALEANVIGLGTFWGDRQMELIAHLLTVDVDHFLTWPEVVATMFVGDSEVVKIEHAALMESEDWPLWREVINETTCGHAPRLSWADYTSGNLIHQAYHLHRWQTATGRRVSELQTIVEIGAGYGALPLLVRRAGFTGRYVIIDLPAFSLLQNYYLAQANVEADWAMPGDELTADLVVGLWSLSEMAPAAQASALSGIMANGYLVAGCGALNIPQIEQAARYETIDHLPPNGYWLL
jgi:hypothetical protein